MQSLDTSGDGTVGWGEFQRGLGVGGEAAGAADAAVRHRPALSSYLWLSISVDLSLGSLSCLRQNFQQLDVPSQAERSLPACEDDLEACADWGEEGECERNPDFMRARCRLACLVRSPAAFFLR